MFSFLKILNKNYKFHFIGIGGIGMSGLAKILLQNGFSVSGSDIKSTDITNDLISLGAKINIGHSKENINNSNIIVYSAAIKSDNCEYKEALEKNLVIISRSELLNEITLSSISIAVSGTHGKTTTSSIISKILLDNLLDPIIVIGGISPFLNGNMHCGKGNFSVYEACEAYGALYSYNPKYAIITNVELEHLDYFKDIDHIIKEFKDFINRIPFYGKAIINGDDLNLLKIIKDYKKSLITYGLKNPGLNLRADNIIYKNKTTEFDVIYSNKKIGSITSPLLGKHNVYNVLAAVAVSCEIGVNFNIIAKSIYDFKNSERRLQLIGEINKINVFSDYAHHPSEISATISSVRQIDPSARLISIFQPHLFSRTKDFYKQFAESLSKSDIIYLLPIYPARELPIQGISSKIIEKQLNHLNKNSLSFTSEETILKHLESFEFEKDCILLLGAGDVHNLSYKIFNLLQNRFYRL